MAAKIETTPEMVKKVYESTKSKLQIIRKRLGRDLTLAEKIIYLKLLSYSFSLLFHSHYSHSRKKKEIGLSTIILKQFIKIQLKLYLLLERKSIQMKL